MDSPNVKIDWPPADSDGFVQMLALFAEHLSADELRRGLLAEIHAHGRSLLEHLERLILSERVADPDRRAMIVAAIGWTGRASSTTAIRAALDDRSDVVVRAAALAAWANLRQPRLVPRLLAIVSQPTVAPDVAVAAAVSLSQFGARQALPEIVRLALRQPTRLGEEEREQLLAAIERLAGVRFGQGEPEEAPLRQRLARVRAWWQAQAAGE